MISPPSRVYVYGMGRFLVNRTLMKKNLTEPVEGTVNSMYSFTPVTTSTRQRIRPTEHRTPQGNYACGFMHWNAILAHFLKPILSSEMTTFMRLR